MTATLETRYARSGDVNIAYQVVGEGAVDLVYVPGFLSHLEWNWEYEPVARFFRRLGSFSRLILFDKRGTGLSDPVSGVPTLEERMDDIRAVMDAVDSERAVLFGVFDGGPMCLLFAATYPERTSGLVLYASLAKFTQDADYPWGWSPASIQLYLAAAEPEWGTDAGAELLTSTLAEDELYRNWFARLLRLSASPGMALSLLRMNTDIDVREVLPAVRVPTLIIHRRDDSFVTLGHSAYMAEKISGAMYLELDGSDHWPWCGPDRILAEVQEFATGVRGIPEPDRVLTTVLFVDVVSSTERAVALGDGPWRELLGQYMGLVRSEVARCRGREVDTAGDGLLATFDGPARAIRCGRALHDAAAQLGIELRVGVHTGECEVFDGRVAGLTVHVGARLAACAEPREVLVSSTVKDLVAGSGIRFEDRGCRTLKGVPGEWQLFAAILEPGEVVTPSVTIPRRSSSTKEMR